MVCGGWNASQAACLLSCRFCQYHEIRSGSEWCNEATRTIYAWVRSYVWVRIFPITFVVGDIPNAFFPQILHVDRKHDQNRHSLTTGSRSLCSIPETSNHNATKCLPTFEKRINQQCIKEMNRKGGPAGLIHLPQGRYLDLVHVLGRLRTPNSEVAAYRLLPSVSKVSSKDSSLYQYYVNHTQISHSQLKLLVPQEE